MFSHTRFRRVIGGVSFVLAMAALALMGWFLQPAQASPEGGIFHVAPSGQCGGVSICYGSIQEAVDAAGAGAEIRVAGGTYTGVAGRPRIDVFATGLVTQVVYIDKGLTLVGGFSPSNWTTPDPNTNPTIIDAQGLGRVIYVAGNFSAHLENFTLINGDATEQWGKPSPNQSDTGGGVYVYQAALRMTNCVISGSVASRLQLAQGGGFYAYTSAGVDIVNSTIENNKASVGPRGGDGGGLAFFNSRVTLQGSTVQNNVGAASRGGFGGGLYMNEGTLTLLNNKFQANTGSTSQSSIYVGHGGAVYVDTGTVTVTNNTFESNTGGRGGWSVGSFSGRGGALYFAKVDLTMTGNIVRNNTGTTGGKGIGGAVYVSGLSAVMVDNQFVDNISSTQNYGYGGGVAIEVTNPVVLENNTISGNRCSLVDTCLGGGIYLQGSTSRLTHNTVTNNIGGADGYGRGGGLYLHGGSVTLDRNTIVGNTAVVDQASTGWGGGIYVSSVAFTFTNNIVAANNGSTHGSGLYIQFPAVGSSLNHNTIADNTGAGEGIFLTGEVLPSYALPIQNGIIAGHANVGVTATSGGKAALDGTLWANNGANTGGDGTITTQNDHAGDPVFVNPAGGDYHIGPTSAALDKASASGLLYDMDNQVRPNGAAADLGADEYYPGGPTARASKDAFAPQWWVRVDPITGAVTNRYIQRYLIEFEHTTPTLGDPGLLFQVIDTLPAGMSYGSAWTSPQMNLQQNGQQLSWETQTPLLSGQPGQILLSTFADAFAPGTVVTNTAQVSGGTWDFALNSPVQAPLFPPIILAPGSGEKCPEPSMTVIGQGYPGQIVKIYESRVEVAEGVIDSQGTFTVTYAGVTQADAGSAAAQTILTAKTCLASDPTQCSAESKAVQLSPPTSFYCPQASTWEDTPTSGPLAGQHVVYRFRDSSGKFVSNNWRITAPFSFSNTKLNLKVRGCPPELGELDSVWIGIDDVGSFTPTSIASPWYYFDVNANITEGFHLVHFYASCLPPGNAPATQLTADASFEVSDGGKVLDLTTGQPVQGVTVTLMMSSTEWGGWVPWPAKSYGETANPQITGADGAVNFLAPPGQYYLQVEAKPGYQSWRSPILTQTVDFKTPITPLPAAADVKVDLTASGPQPQTIFVTPGTRVQWQVPQGTPLADMALIDDPALRLRSDLDPLAFSGGWDGGMMAPGQAYAFTFATKGVYPYSDGAGHTGIVRVGDVWRAYLPFLAR